MPRQSKRMSRQPRRAPLRDRRLNGLEPSNAQTRPGQDVGEIFRTVAESIFSALQSYTAQCGKQKMQVRRPNDA